MVIQEADVRRLVFVRMNPGDDLLACLQEAAAARGIRQGAIVNGVGSLSAYHVHAVETTNMPPGDVFFHGTGPYDILTLAGVILHGRVHAHITLANREGALGGHVEPGCTVLTFCLAYLADTPEADLTDWDRLDFAGVV